MRQHSSADRETRDVMNLLSLHREVRTAVSQDSRLDVNVF